MKHLDTEYHTPLGRNFWHCYGCHLDHESRKMFIVLPLNWVVIWDESVLLSGPRFACAIKIFIYLFI